MKEYIEALKNLQIQISISQIQAEETLDSIKKIGKIIDEVQIHHLDDELKVEADRLTQHTD